MKEKIISRTIESTTATILVFNAKENKLSEIVKSFSGNVNSEDILKNARKTEETEEQKIVMVKSIDVTSKLYGMKESQFIAKGFVLDERTAKVDGEKIITRSIESSIVHFKAFNVSKMEMVNATEYFSGKVNAENALKALRDVETEDIKIVMVDSVESDVKLYAIKESVFLEYAFELPPRMNNEKEEEA